MKMLVASIILFISIQVNSQCVVQKTGSYYGFFRVTNFKEKVCWLSEPFAYSIKNGEIANYDQIKKCFINNVTALGGNVGQDLDAFGINKVKWLDNTYDPNADLPSSANWGLPSKNDCIKWIKDEIHYKTGVGISVKIIKMYSKGTIDPNTR
jgi:hypothetical protein